MFKDEDGNGTFGGVQFEAKLFLDCGEDTGRQVGIRCSVEHLACPSFSMQIPRTLDICRIGAMLAVTLTD